MEYFIKNFVDMYHYDHTREDCDMKVMSTLPRQKLVVYEAHQLILLCSILGVLDC